MARQTFNKQTFYAYSSQKKTPMGLQIHAHVQIIYGVVKIIGARVLVKKDHQIYITLYGLLGKKAKNRNNSNNS